MTTTIICTDETIMLSEDETVALQQISPYLKEVAQLEVGDTLDFNITSEIFRALVDYAVSKTQCVLESHQEIFEELLHPYDGNRHFYQVYVGSVYVGDGLYENENKHAIEKCTCKYPFLSSDNNEFAKLLQFNVAILNEYIKRFVNGKFFEACQTREWENARKIMSIEAPFQLLTYTTIESGFLHCCEYRNLSMAKQLFILLQRENDTNKLTQTWATAFGGNKFGQTCWQKRIDVVKWLYSSREFKNLILDGLFKYGALKIAIILAFNNSQLELGDWLYSLYIYHKVYTKRIYDYITDDEALLEWVDSQKLNHK